MNFKLFESFSELDGEIVERSERRRRPRRVWAGLAVAAACVAVIVAVAVPGLRHGGAVEPEQMQDPAPMPAPTPEPTPDPDPGTAYEPTPGPDPAPELAPAPEPDPSPAPEPEPAPSLPAPEPDNYWSAEEMCGVYYGVAYFEELPDGVEAAADFTIEFGDGSVGYHISRELFDEIAGEAGKVVMNTDVESEDAMVVVGAPWMDITCMLPPEVTYNECLSAVVGCPTEEFFDLEVEPMTAAQLGYVWPRDFPAALLGDGDEEYYVNHCNVRGWARYNDGGIYEMALEYRDEELGKAARITVLPVGQIYVGEHLEPEGEAVTSFMGQLEFTAYRYATDKGVRLRAEFEIGLARYFVDVETDADDRDEAEGKLVLESVVSCFQRNAMEGVYPDFGAFRQGDGESGGTRVGAPCGGG